MLLDQKSVLVQLDKLILEAGKFEPYKGKSVTGFTGYFNVPDAELCDFLTRAVAAIERIAPKDSAYRQTVKTTLPKYDFAHTGRIDPYVGVLKALRSDCELGYLRSVIELAHAAVFGDFLEMAEHLFEQGYKDPAAVITGSVLEEHLRKLCDKHEIEVTKDGKPKKADHLNAELASKNAFSKLDQKNVTAWLDLRNKAAHGEYSEYTKDQVALLIQSVRDFITRNPA